MSRRHPVVPSPSRRRAWRALTSGLLALGLLTGGIALGPVAPAAAADPLPTGVTLEPATSPNVEVYFTASGGIRLANGLSNDGVFLPSSPQGALGVTFAADGTAYIATNSNVQRITPDGTNTTILPGASGAKDVALDLNGNLYVTRANQLDKVDLGTLTTTTVQTFPGAAAGVATDPRGNVYVVYDALLAGDKVDRIAPDGTVTNLATNLNNAYGVDVDPAGNVYYSLRTQNLSDGRIIRIAPDGTSSTFASGLLNPKSIAVGPDGEVYVRSNGTPLIQRIAPTGVSANIGIDNTSGFGIAVRTPVTKAAQGRPLTTRVTVQTTGTSSVAGGSVTVTEGTTVLGTGTLSGTFPYQATVSVATGGLSVGRHTLRANFTGTSANAGSTGAAFLVDVVLPPTTAADAPFFFHPMGNAPFGTTLRGTNAPAHPIVTNGDGRRYLTSLTPSVCYIGPDSVSIVPVDVGDCTVVAKVDDGVAYAAATGLPQTVTFGAIQPSDPGIFNLPISPQRDTSFVANVVSTSDGTRRVEVSSNGGQCYVGPDGLTVYFVKVGNCSINAFVEATPRYFARSKSIGIISVSRGTPSAPTITNLPTSAVAKQQYVATVSTTGDGATGVTSTTPEVCAVLLGTAATVVFDKAGTCTLTPTVAQGAEYLAATGTPQSFTVAKAARTISVNDVPVPATSGQTFTPTYFAGSTQLTGTTTSATPAVCRVGSDGVSLTLLAAGTCTFTGSVAGDAAYLDAQSAPVDVTVGQGLPSLLNTPDTATYLESFLADVAEVSPGAPSVRSLTPTVCTVASDGLTVSFVDVGTCTLEPRRAASGNVGEVIGGAVSFTVSPAEPTTPVLLNQPVDPKAGTSYDAVILTNGDGTRSVASTTPAVCSVGANGRTVTFLAVGACELTPKLSAGTRYLGADGTPVQLTVAKGTSSIAVRLPGNAVIDGFFLVTYDKVGDGTPSVTSSSPLICEVGPDGQSVRFVAAGTCRLQAAITGTANFDAAVGAVQTFTVQKKTPTTPVIQNLPTNPKVFDTFFANVDTTSDGRRYVTSTTPGTCTVAQDELTVTFTAPGTCSLVPAVLGSATYLGAINVAQSVTVLGATPSTPTIENLPTTATFGGSFTAVVTTNGDGTRSVSSSTPTTCTVGGDGLTVTYAAAGNCILVARVTSGPQYAAADGFSQSFQIARLASSEPTIAILPTDATVGGSFTAVVDTNGDGLRSVQTDTPTICSVQGLLVTYLKVGRCDLRARVADGPGRAAATGQLQFFSIGRGVPTTPTITPLPAATAGTTVSVTVATTGDGTRSVSSSTTAVCTASGLQVTFLTTGTCSLTAAVAQGTDYLAATGTEQTVTVALGAPSTPSITNLPGSGTFGGGFTATVGTTGDGAKSVTSSSPTVCTVGSGTSVTYVGVGTCTLTAQVAEGTNFAGATGSPQSFDIGRAAPTAPTISNLPAAAAVGGSFTPTVTTTGDGTTSVTSGTPAVCTSSSGTVSYLTAGTCTLRAAVAQGAHYLAADGSPQSFTVGPGTPTAPTITNLPASAAVGGGFTPTVSTTGDGAKTVVTSTPAVCTVSGGTTVTYVGVGSCGLTAKVAAGTNYQAATGSEQSITVSLGTASTPTITNLPGSGTFGGGFTATVGTDGDGTKSVTSSTPTVCTVGSGTTVTYVGVGTCTLTAQVTTGANYAGATGTPQSFDIGRATASTPSITNVPGNAAIGGGFTAVVSTTGDGVKSVTSSTPTVCTASGLQVTFGGAGTCTLTARVTEGTNRLAADGTPQSFTVADVIGTTTSVSSPGAAYGRPVTITATVTPAQGTGPVPGTVQFSQGSTNLGSPVALQNGQASITLPSLLPDQTITATYLGSGIYQSSSGTVVPAIGFGKLVTGLIRGNLVLPEGTWLVRTADVRGSITIGRNASVVIVDTVTTGSVLASRAANVSVCGTRVGGDVNLASTSGPVVVGNPSAGCAANTIGWGVSLTGNVGGVTFAGNAVGRNATVSSNAPSRVTTQRTIVSANRITGTLTCAGNRPVAGNGGSANTVGGRRSGECSSSSSTF